VAPSATPSMDGTPVCKGTWEIDPVTGIGRCTGHMGSGG
jgi:hypothetical protein